MTPRPQIVPAPQVNPTYEERGQSPPDPTTHGALALAFSAQPRPATRLALIIGPALGGPGATDAGRRRRLAQALAEALFGYRPASTLRDLLTPRAYHRLVQHAGTASTRRTRPRVKEVRTDESTPDVVEVAAVVWDDRRARALALRFERQGRRWLCSAFETTTDQGTERVSAANPRRHLGVC